MYQRFHLSHEDAIAIIAVFQEELKKMEKEASLAVVDSRGELIAFLRTDGAKLHTGNIAISKAYTAARQQMDSKAYGDFSSRFTLPASLVDTRLVGFGGGIPIFFNDQLVGAVGISGMKEEEDIELAKICIDQFNTEK